MIEASARFPPYGSPFFDPTFLSTHSGTGANPRSESYDIISTPAPIPILMTPDLISAATLATAWRPEEQKRLTAERQVSYGKPAWSMAMRDCWVPAPGSLLEKGWETAVLHG